MSQWNNIREDNNEVEEVDPSFCYHRHGGGDEDDEQREAPPLNLYGRRPPTVVTSTRFDDDEVFGVVARSMLFRLERDNMTEREAIQTTLASKEDRRAFLEALDLKYACVMGKSFDDRMGEVESETSDFQDVVLRTRSAFASTLQWMWRESTKDVLHSAIEPELTVDHLNDYYNGPPPKTPKNLVMSPVQCAYDRCSELAAKGSELASSISSAIQHPSKRRRRWFFAEANDESINTNPLTAINSSIGRGRFHFDFKLPSSSSGKARSVQSLSLDGAFGPMPSVRSREYAPPTSPIQRMAQLRE